MSGTHHIGIDKVVSLEEIENNDYYITISHRVSNNKYSFDGEPLSEKEILNVEVRVYEKTQYGGFSLIDNKYTHCRYDIEQKKWVWITFGTNYITNRDTYKNDMNMGQAHYLVLSLVKKYSK